MIYRDYACIDCGAEFEVIFEHSDDPVPDCPVCAKVLEWKPKSFNITGHKAKAIDYTQKVIEEEYGMTNLKDNNREGDVAAMMPVETTAAREDRVRMEREIAEMAAQVKGAPAPAAEAFWGGQSTGAPPPNQMMAQTMIASGKVGPGSEVNPMKMLQDGIKSGQIPRKERIIASWKP